MVVPRGAFALGNLDDATFIAGLEERGMSELILHLLEVDPPDDPVVRDLIAIATHRLRYRNEALPREQRDAAFRDALGQLEALIAGHAGHPQRPIWQTDLASLLLIDDLRTNRRLAAASVRFGVPTEEQERAFADLSRRALAATSEARRGLFDLRGALARDDERREALESDGTFRRLFQDYGELRLPYYHALASLYVGWLDERPAAERRDLLRVAVESIEPLSDPATQAEAIARGALTILGELRLIAGEPQEAVGPLERARELGGGGADRVVATLALAQAIAETGRLPRAEALLEALADDEGVATAPTYRLLVADAHHRLLRRQARDDAGIAASYEPYLDLLEDGSLEPRTRQALRLFIYRRWSATAPTQREVATLPPIVRLGIGEHLLNRARRASAAGEPEAAGLFARANAVNETLRDASLPGRVRANGLYHLALGIYFASPGDASAAAEAAGYMADVADDHPDQPVSERAIANAVSLTRPAAADPRGHAAARAAYVRAVGVLLEKYPITAAADAERYPFAAAILQPRGEHERAVEVLDGVPRGHAAYFDAQAGRLRSLAALLREATADADREARRETLAAEATRLKQEAVDSPQLASGSPAMRAWAESRFALATVALSRGEVGAMLDELEGFQDDFEDDPDLLRRGYQETITAYAEADRLGDAVALAEEMTQRFPEASAFVIDRVVTRLDAEIESLRQRADAEAAPTVQRELRAEAQARADAAAQLTTLLLAWAERQGFEPPQLLAYQVLHAETLRLAGRAEASLAILEPLVAAHPSDGTVLFEHGQALYALGEERDDPELLGRALRAFGPLSSANLYPRPLPEMYWISNLRIVQIMDARGDDSTDIVLRIRRLEQQDPNLGGEATRRAFNALRAANL